MARIALISDVHGNLEALASVLHDIARVGVDRLVCLGDIVGYGPDPGPCVDLVFEHASVVVRGNHDEAAVNPAIWPAFNERARASIETTRRLLDFRQRSFLAGLQETGRLGPLMLTHATFAEDEGWTYVYGPEEAARSFRGLDGRIGAFGHTHVPGLIVAPYERLTEPGSLRLISLDGAQACVRIPDECRALLNPGSVGQPRDGDPAASWGLLDQREMTFSVRRVVYDVERVSEKIRAMGLPPAHGERLRIGA